MKTLHAMVSFGCVCLAGISQAHADAVPPEPPDCPDGTRGESCHGGPYCEPITCTTDAQCPSGKQCVEVDFMTRDVYCSGHRPVNAPPPAPVVGVMSLCEKSPVARACTKLRVCTTRTTPVAEPAPATTAPIAEPAPPATAPPATTAPSATNGQTGQAPPPKKGCAAGEADFGLWAGLAILAFRSRRRGATLATLALATIAVTAGASSVRADVIDEPPKSCPVQGSRPASCHGGPYCAVTACDQCGADQVCQPVPVCVEDIQCAGDVNPEDLPKYLRPNVLGTCAADRSCAKGKCRDLQMCVPKAAPPATTAPPTTPPATSTPTNPPKKSGCEGGNGPGPVGLAGMLVAWFMWMVGRRR